MLGTVPKEQPNRSNRKACGLNNYESAGEATLILTHGCICFGNTSHDTAFAATKHSIVF